VVVHGTLTHGDDFTPVIRSNLEVRRPLPIFWIETEARKGTKKKAARFPERPFLSHGSLTL
jgi:hypothetical protein